MSRSFIGLNDSEQEHCLHFSLGLAFGGIFVPVVAWTMQTWGWRSTAFCSGLAFILIGWPLARNFKRRPADVGQTVDGLPARDDLESEESGQSIEFTARQALRTSAFWLLSLGHGSALFVVTAVNVHAITHMKEGLGYSVAQASLVITLMTVFQIVGVLIGWWCGDRFEKRKISALCMVMHASGLMMLAWSQATWMLIGFAILHGAAWGLRGPFMQALRARLFWPQVNRHDSWPIGHHHHGWPNWRTPGRWRLCGSHGPLSFGVYGTRWLSGARFGLFLASQETASTACLAI